MARRATRSAREIGITILLCLVIVWLIALLASIFRKEEIARSTVNETRAELSSLDTRKAELSATVQNLDTARGKDESLRETYGVAKPGEDVIIVVPKDTPPPPPQMTFWDKVKQFLGIEK